MSLSRPAVALLEYLSARYGRRIGEAEVREALEISHGTFVKSRRELVERSFLVYEPGVGSLSPIYRSADAVVAAEATAVNRKDIDVQNKVINAKDATVVTDKAAMVKNKVTGVKNKVASLHDMAVLAEVSFMARVTGAYESLDAWVDDLQAALGDVDVDDYGDGSYGVYGHDCGRRDMYQVEVQSDGSVLVS